MNKTCKKCGYERNSEDTAPDYECPKCGAVYAKVEAFLKREQERTEHRKAENLGHKTATITPESTKGPGFWSVFVAGARGIFRRFDQIRANPVEIPSSPRVTATRLHQNPEISAKTNNPSWHVQEPVTASKEAGSMGDQWYFSRDGKQAGAVSEAELTQLASSGQLSPTDMVWKEGMSGWVHAAKVKGLFLATNTIGPPPLPAASTGSLTTTQNDPLSILRAPVIAGLHRQRFAICVLAGIGMLATFMPWIHAPIVGSISGTAGDGWITLVLFTPAMVLAIRGQKLAPLLNKARLGAVIPAGLVCLLGLYKAVEFNSRMGNVDQDNPFAAVMVASAYIDIGLYMLIAASASLVAVAWFLAKPLLEQGNLCVSGLSADGDETKKPEQ